MNWIGFISVSPDGLFNCQCSTCYCNLRCILSLLIAVYNRPSVTIAVDELDAGIFEYLLGELLRIIAEKGKGQLIFTSHNLRPLETLDKGCIAFTTTNPNNRYIRPKNVKSSNNLRDFYYRDITLGEQAEEVYKPTQNAEISYAFKKAGVYKWHEKNSASNRFTFICIRRYSMFNFYSELLLRLQKQFVSEHESDFKSIEDLLEAFMTQYNRGDFNNTIEMKLRDLYEAAEEADTNEKSRKLYNEILALCPDEVDAKRELIALELHPSFQIYQLKQLVESLKKPKKIDWNIIETRPYMRCLIDMGMIYLAYNMYNDAIACFTPVFHGDKQDHSGFLVYMMVACCGAANWDRGRKVYQRYLACCDDIQNAFNQAPDIMLPMHMLYILLALQCGESKIAHDVLADLVDEYEDIDWLLQDATRWNDFVEDHLEAIMYMVDQVSNIDSDPRELISLYTAISFLPTQLVDFESPLWQTLYDAYERVTGRTVIKRYSNDSYMGKRESAHMSPVEVAKGGALRGNPVYDNIRFGAQITLSQAGLYTVDDFKTITKQEVLMLPGIGKKTVEQLEHNGVIFKV